MPTCTNKKCPPELLPAFARGATDNLKLNHIEALTAAAYGLSATELRAQTRAERIVWPRQVAMFLMREMTTFSLVEIGDYFSRDHGTVVHAFHRVTGRAECYPVLKAAIEKIKEQVLKEVS